MSSAYPKQYQNSDICWFMQISLRSFYSLSLFATHFFVCCLSIRFYQRQCEEASILPRSNFPNLYLRVMVFQESSSSVYTSFRATIKLTTQALRIISFIGLQSFAIWDYSLSLSVCIYYGNKIASGHLSVSDTLLFELRSKVRNQRLLSLCFWDRNQWKRDLKRYTSNVVSVLPFQIVFRS